MPLPHHILAQDADDIVKIIFGVVFAIIWAVSGLLSWLNKRHQEAQRRRAEEELARATRFPGQQAPPPPVPHPPAWRGPVGDVAPLPSSRMPPSPRRISEGLATRHPQVLRPPAPPPLPRPAQRRPMPPPIPAAQHPQRRAKKGARRQPQQQLSRRGGQQQRGAVEPMLPTLEIADEPSSVTGVSSSAPIQATAIGNAPGARARAGAGPAASAATLRRWLTPQTLRSQYILTEVLQPPLAMRPDRMDQ